MQLGSIQRAFSRRGNRRWMEDETNNPVCIGDGSAPSLRSLARIDLDPYAYAVLHGAGQDSGIDPREHLLARITPRELVFIQHVCLHPEQTDEEISAALGLPASTMEAYYAHLGRNFQVRNSWEVRRWAFKNQLVPASDVGPVPDPPDPGFDPWVRWY